MKEWLHIQGSRVVGVAKASIALQAMQNLQGIDRAARGFKAMLQRK